MQGSTPPLRASLEASMTQAVSPLHSSAIRSVIVTVLLPRQILNLSLIVENLFENLRLCWSQHLPGRILWFFVHKWRCRSRWSILRDRIGFRCCGSHSRVYLFLRRLVRKRWLDLAFGTCLGFKNYRGEFSIFGIILPKYQKYFRFLNRSWV